MFVFSIRLLVKIVVLATCTKACFLSQKVYYRRMALYSLSKQQSLCQSIPHVVRCDKMAWFTQTKRGAFNRSYLDFSTLFVFCTISA
ncbi:hypothetical protein [Cardinium endosymbiont of Tipula unca]|uniref:hypothetical protein n=1 Tax=Cardinium endosymbiont of Tipula unca TaxID=3066216 RepID=UPI0030D06EFE